MKKLFLYAAVLLLTATACTTEDSNFPTVNAPTVTATIQQADSRVAVDAVKDAVTSLKWESGDQILVVDADGKEATYATTSTGSSATFTKASGDDIATTGAHTAYSPADGWKKPLENRGYRFMFDSQTYSEGTFDASAMPMMAENTNGLDFTFTPLAAVLRLNIMAGSEGIEVNSIKLDNSVSGLYLCGGAFWEDGGFSFLHGMNAIYLNCESAVALSETPTAFYMVIPPVNVPAQSLTISITTNQGEIVKTSSVEADFQAGKVYDINLTVEAPAAATHDYVDLGTVVDGKTVLWATTNVGADNPWEYGGSYAWGETKAYGEEDTSNAHNYAYGNTYTKTYYDFCTYKWATGTDWTSISKYSYADGQTSAPWYDGDTYIGLNGVKDQTKLETEDDAATANWGNDWRMPTAAELAALKNNCYWQWVTTYSGKSVEGYMVYKAKDATHQGKMNDGTITASYSGSDVHIFLPAAGYRYDSNLDGAGYRGNYWSSGLSSNSDDARSLYFYAGDVNAYGSNFRCYGLSVRPVRLVQN